MTSIGSEDGYRVIRDHDFRAPDFVPARVTAAPLLSLVEVRQPAPLPECTLHYHRSYEFAVPHQPITMVIGYGDKRRETRLPKNLLFALNSDQEHGPGMEPDKLVCHAFMVDQGLVREAANAIGIKGPVEFMNSARPLSAVIRALTGQFVEEARGRQAGYEFLLELISLQLTIYLVRACRGDPATMVGPVEPVDSKGISRVIEFFQDNPSCQYSLEDVARVADMDRYRFIRTFKTQTGKTPHGYLTDLKIERACQYLRDSRMSMTDICIACGFSDSSHFSTVFKRRIGMPPSQYRRQFS